MTSLVLQNRHTGERLELRRITRKDEVWLEIRGSLPPHSEGPPMHIHFLEDEEGVVHAGILSAQVDGQRIDVQAGGNAQLPKGSAHRWWNEGDETLEFTGYARPVVDLDRYLQAVFDVVNASPRGRPSLVYMAHVVLRHRNTQKVLLMPRILQTALFRTAYAFGLLTGRYSGSEWPGSPGRCRGAPVAADID